MTSTIETGTTIDSPSEHSSEQHRDLSEDTEIYVEFDGVELARQEYVSKDRWWSRFSIAMPLNAIVASVVLFLVGWVGVIDPLSDVFALLFAGVLSWFLITIPIGQAASRYYHWRADGLDPARSYYFQYVDGSTEPISEGEAYALGAPPPVGVCPGCAMDTTASGDDQKRTNANANASKEADADADTETERDRDEQEAETETHS